MLSDQLREEMKRDELVNEGRMSRSEADQQIDEWKDVSHLSSILFCTWSVAVMVGRNTIAEV